MESPDLSEQIYKPDSIFGLNDVAYQCLSASHASCRKAIFDNVRASAFDRAVSRGKAGTLKSTMIDVFGWMSKTPLLCCAWSTSCPALGGRVIGYCRLRAAISAGESFFDAAIGGKTLRHRCRPYMHSGPSGAVRPSGLPDRYGKRALIIEGSNCWWGYDTYKESEKGKMEGMCAIDESRTHVHFKHKRSKSEVDLVLKDGALVSGFALCADSSRKGPKPVTMHREEEPTK